MVVSIASDHAGYELRQKVRKYLEEKGFEVLDGGAPNGTDSYGNGGQAYCRDDDIPCDRSVKSFGGRKENIGRGPGEREGSDEKSRLEEILVIKKRSRQKPTPFLLFANDLCYNSRED